MNHKRLLIFGGSGFVGMHLAKLAQLQSWSVILSGRRELPVPEGMAWQRADIHQKGLVLRAIEAARPQAVVNAAAQANIDLAEQDPSSAWQINVDGAQHVANACAELGIRAIFFSSDAVFNGKGQNYIETDLPAPVNYYGHTKAEMERIVAQANPQAVVLRIAIVLGFPLANGTAFFTSLENKLKAGKEYSAPVDEIRSPIDVLTLSQTLLELAENEFAGLLHLGSTDNINRFDLSRWTARALGYDENFITQPTTDPNQPGRAPRHKNGSLCVAKAQSILKTRMVTIEESLQRVISRTAK